MQGAVLLSPRHVMSMSSHASSVLVVCMLHPKHAGGAASPNPSSLWC